MKKVGVFEGGDTPMHTMNCWLGLSHFLIVTKETIGFKSLLGGYSGKSKMPIRFFLKNFLKELLKQKK